MQVNFVIGEIFHKKVIILLKMLTRILNSALKLFASRTNWPIEFSYMDVVYHILLLNKQFEAHTQPIFTNKNIPVTFVFYKCLVDEHSV